MKKTLILFLLLFFINIFGSTDILAKCNKYGCCPGSQIPNYNGRCRTNDDNNNNTVNTNTQQIQPTSTPVLIATVSVTPTVIPTPDPEEVTTPPSIGSKDYCQSLTISGTTLNPGGTLTVKSTANNTNIKTFSYRFFNVDNTNKAIVFKIDNKNLAYTRTIPNIFTSNTNTITVNFPQLDRNDLAWSSSVYGNPKPKKIMISAYFTDAGNATSKKDTKCEVTFTATTVDPTPTPDARCTCNSSNVCNTSYCKFDKHTTTGTNITYASSQNCGIPNIFQNQPTANMKNAICQRYFMTKGDANGDGKATFLDYFYYVAARYGGKVASGISPDFNGNNLIDDNDKEIIIKSIKQ